MGIYNQQSGNSGFDFRWVSKALLFTCRYYAVYDMPSLNFTVNINENIQNDWNVKNWKQQSKLNLK